ncbi:hypothetical protein LTS18_000847, partial [Coniosporium uncinatum]
SVWSAADVQYLGEEPWIPNFLNAVYCERKGLSIAASYLYPLIKTPSPTQALKKKKKKKSVG